MLPNPGDLMNWSPSQALMNGVGPSDYAAIADDGVKRSGKKSKKGKKKGAWVRKRR